MRDSRGTNGDTGTTRSRRRGLLLGAGIVATVVLMYFAVRGTDLGQVRQAFEESEVWWLLPALLVLAAAVFLRALRWRYLFEHSTRPSVRTVLAAYLVGQLYNNILPLRAGEAARILAVSRGSRTSRAEATATVFIERVFDISCLLVLLFVVAPWLPELPWLRAAVVAAVVVAIGLAALIAMLARYGSRPFRLALRPLRRMPGFTDERVGAVAGNLERGLGSVRTVRRAALVAGLTMLSWLVMSISFWLATLAFELPHSLLVGVIVVVATNLAQILPSAPAALGVFEAATLVALTPFDASRPTALSYAIVLHVLNSFPYLVAGPIAMRAISSEDARTPA